MRLLLDTHTFIWWDDNYQRLPLSLQRVLNNSQHTLYLSLVSIWEMQIKIQLGKLSFDIPLRQKISQQKIENNLQTLPITESHIYALGELPHHHKDPFDRLLIAQAQTEDLVLVTHDSHISDYDVHTIWDNL